MNTIRTAYEKCQSGAALTNTEIEVGIRHFTALEALLAPLGPEFAFARKEASRTVMTLEGFALARNLRVR